MYSTEKEAERNLAASKNEVFPGDRPLTIARALANACARRYHAFIPPISIYLGEVNEKFIP